ncbi:hypothetical protein [Streptomyces sp. NPDC046161]|uniref:hypothetical protein n=1 Tax=Streptomyces sp. NPDC046161 TaxID=3155132 RepID=UPI0033E95175
MSSEPGSRGSRLRSQIAWWLGISSAIIGILAFFLTQCANKSPSFNQWKAKAIAACNQEVPGIVEADWKSINTFRRLQPGNSVGSVEREEAASAKRQFDMAVQHLVGTWRALEQPDERQEEIKTMYEDAMALAITYGDSAEAVRSNTYKDELYDNEEKARVDLRNDIKSLDLENGCSSLAA